MRVENPCDYCGCRIVRWIPWLSIKHLRPYRLCAKCCEAVLRGRRTT